MQVKRERGVERHAGGDNCVRRGINREIRAEEPARVDDAARARVDGGLLTAVSLGGEPLEARAVGVHGEQVRHKQATALGDLREARRREDDAPVGQPRRIEVVVAGEERVGARAEWRQVECAVGARDGHEPGAVGAHGPDAPRPVFPRARREDDARCVPRRDRVRHVVEQFALRHQVMQPPVGLAHDEAPVRAREHRRWAVAEQRVGGNGRPGSARRGGTG